MLTEQQRLYRRDKVTASDARKIMNAASDADLLALYDEKLSTDPIVQTWAMKAGEVMEDLIKREYELVNNIELARVQRQVDHPTIKNFMATLDGYVESERKVIEIKFASPFLSRDELFRMYYPQVAFQMACTDAATGTLFVAQGTAPPFEIECIRDPFVYEPELLERCAAFLLCLKTMQPPCARPIITPPERWRSIDISVDQVNWGGELTEWLRAYDESADAALLHEECAKKARDLVPEDVGKVIAGNFTLSRNKKGVISIRRAA